MQNDIHEFELLIRSRIPLIVVESHEEDRVLAMLDGVCRRVGRPLFAWSLTDGLQRMDTDMGRQASLAEPEQVLKHIKAVGTPGVFVLRDFHPFIDKPLYTRLLKDIAIRHDELHHTVVLLSHEIEMPAELSRMSARFDIPLPDAAEIDHIVDETIRTWQQRASIAVSPEARQKLVDNLSGLALADVRRLARSAIADDHAVSEQDLPRVLRAKYELLARDGVLHFEPDAAKFSDIGGFASLKRWLSLRHDAFIRPGRSKDQPRGILLLGVQGCGKSLAAKAVAGTWGTSLLRLDFGAVYDKYYGETEKNLRDALATAEALAPCVLWIDELEKGLAGGSGDDGLSRRVLGSLLTWMSEPRDGVFLVATANDIQALPPELVRKGRFDEVFFVDLPDAQARREILRIHCGQRDIPVTELDMERLVQACDGFSGAEIEQAIIAAGYSCNGKGVSTAELLEEFDRTRPLAVLMAEKVSALRRWAANRTVPA